MFKSHHYWPFDKTDKAYKECLRPSLTLLLVGILMSPWPTCLPLALLLLIFLYPCPSSSFLVPPPSPLFVDAINYATAPCAQLHRRLKRSFRSSRCRTDDRRLPRLRENRRRTGLEKRLESNWRRMSREFGYEIHWTAEFTVETAIPNHQCAIV